MRDSVRALLPHEFRKAAVELYTDGREACELIPLACRNAAQLPQSGRTRRRSCLSPTAPSGRW